MIDKTELRPLEAEPIFENEPGARSSQYGVNKRDMGVSSWEDWRTGLISTPRTLPPHNAKPKRGCLKKAAMRCPDLDSHNDKSPKHLRFAPLGIHCLITNTPFEERPQDGKAWRWQQSAKLNQGRMVQALSGADEYQARVRADLWADRGWESAGLGEDTPMGGMSQEQDVEAARWRARHMELDQMLEDQRELANQNRVLMEADTRRVQGVHNVTMGTREFVRYRLSLMNKL